MEDITTVEMKPLEHIYIEFLAKTKKPIRQWQIGSYSDEDLSWN